MRGRVIREAAYILVVGTLILGGLWSSYQGNTANLMFAGIGFGIVLTRSFYELRSKVRNWKASEAYRTRRRPVG